jgi:hypothetical protein
MAVIVPVHDEEALLAACLGAVADAAAHLALLRPDVVCRTWAVLDSCTDDSARIAAASGVDVLVVDARNVGMARAAGCAAARRAFARLDGGELWTAHTDADSTVPVHWLAHQIEQADAGADIVIGTVRPDFRDLDAAQTREWWRRYTPGLANGHVHGANLGIRGDLLANAGGFPPLREHEDVRFVAAARQFGAVIVASDDAWVRTSGRTEGRTPGGYARYLREDLVSGVG